MSKQTKGYDMANFDHVTPQTLQRAERVIADQATRRYSVSAIYKAHNEIFKLREPMQTCDSCLVTRANAVKKWHDWYKSVVEPTDPNAQAQAAPDAPVVPISGAVVPFTPEEVDTLRSQYSPADDADFATKLQSTLDAAAASNGSIVLEGDTGARIGLLIAQLQSGSITDQDNAINEEVFAGLGLTDANTPQEYSAAIKAFLVDPTQTITDERREWLTNKAAAIDADTQAPEGAIILQKVDKDTYVADGDAFYAVFTASADDATKGTVVRSDTGKAVAAGTYATEDSTKLLGVQPGGKASYKQIAQ